MFLAVIVLSSFEPIYNFSLALLLFKIKELIKKQQVIECDECNEAKYSFYK